MIFNDLTGVKYVSINITVDIGGMKRLRQVFKLTRKGQVLGYVARSSRPGMSPRRAGWSYCTSDEPELWRNWTQAGIGSTREQAADHLLSALSPSAAWLV